MTGDIDHDNLAEIEKVAHSVEGRVVSDVIIEAAPLLDMIAQIRSLSKANYDYCTENALLKEERDELRKALEPLVDQWNALCLSPDAPHEGLEDRLEVMLRRAARSLSFKKEA